MTEGKEPEGGSRPQSEPGEAELARLRRLSESIGEARPPTPEPPDLAEIDRRLKAGTGRLSQNLRKAGMEEIGQRRADQPPRETYHRTAAVGLAVAYNLAGAVMAGFLLGWAIDAFTGSVWARTIGTVLGAVAGMTAAIMIVFRDPGKQKRK
ncbi:MAG: AtpZ/AtpI family protein [Fimbriimonadaceae bacterium]|nr:AtpZ/AtpI family protein [Fimbriimonadaceae bacterium]